MKILASLAVVALLAQEPSIDLLQEYDQLTSMSGSSQALITLIAEHADGTPVRGVIQCGGQWEKYADGEHVYVEAMPFDTDSRGAVVMNPHIDDEWIVCWAEEGGETGKTMVTFSEEQPTRVQRIVVRNINSGN